MAGQKTYFHFTDGIDALAAIAAWRGQQEARGLPQTRFVLSGAGVVGDISVEERSIDDENAVKKFFQENYAGKFTVHVSPEI